jgi:hypothetical protein
MGFIIQILMLCSSGTQFSEVFREHDMSTFGTEMIQDTMVNRLRTEG